MILKEWRCLEHGDFVATHPACPGWGCQSRFVERVFLTAPGQVSASTRRFDAGLRKSAEMMGIGNFRTVRQGGEAAYGGALGSRVLWGDESQKVLGHSFSELTQMAAQPVSVQKANGEVETMALNNGMRQAATELGVTRRVLPKPAELSIAYDDKQSMDAKRAQVDAEDKARALA